MFLSAYAAPASSAQLKPTFRQILIISNVQTHGLQQTALNKCCEFVVSPGRGHISETCSSDFSKNILPKSTFAPVEKFLARVPKNNRAFYFRENKINSSHDGTAFNSSTFFIVELWKRGISCVLSQRNIEISSRAINEVALLNHSNDENLFFFFQNNC
jgi:hypothetical protein